MWEHEPQDAFCDEICGFDARSVGEKVDNIEDPCGHEAQEAREEEERADPLQCFHLILHKPYPDWDYVSIQVHRQPHITSVYVDNPTLHLYM